jgi:hypothetical protein
MTGLPLHDVLWNLPVAIAYQIELLFWQREGTVFRRDSKAEILKELNG